MLFTYIIIDINGPLRCQASPINNCWDGEQEKIQDDISIDFDDSIENQGAS